MSSEYEKLAREAMAFNCKELSEEEAKRFVENDKHRLIIRNFANEIQDAWKKAQEALKKDLPDKVNAAEHEGPKGGEMAVDDPIKKEEAAKDPVKQGPSGPPNRPSLKKKKGTQPQVRQDEGPSSHRPPDVRVRIANAKVGDEYSHLLTIENEPNVQVQVQDVKGLDAVGGLAFNFETQRIAGEAKKPGAFDLVLTLSAKNKGLPWEVHHKMVIIADPKTLWKNQPSNVSAKFWKPDSGKKGVTVDDQYSAVAASQRGRSHAHHGSCRDDHFEIQEATTTGWHVLAVSDGAGSAEYSRRASELAVQESTDRLREKLDEHDEAVCKAFGEWNRYRTDTNEKKLEIILYKCLSDPVCHAIKKIEEVCSDEKIEFRQLYTTLLIGAHKEIDGHHYVCGYWRGDGAMAYHVPEKYLKLMGKPDSGEYGGQTRFLDKDANNQTDIDKRIVFDAQDEFGTLLLMTDGISDPMFNSDDELQDRKAWDKLWFEQIKGLLSQDTANSASRMLSWMDFWSPGNHDDRTLAVLYRTEGVPDEANLSAAGTSDQGNIKSSSEQR